MGFIIGSLGVVWPWKKTLYRTTENGELLFDSTGEMVIENYIRFFPELNKETWIAIAFIVCGGLIVLMLEIYGNRTRKING